MQTKKVSIAKILAIVLCAAVCAVAFAVPFAMQQKSADNVSAAATSKTVTVTFSDFPEKVAPYVVVSFIGSDGSFTSQVITSSTAVSMNIGGVAGKLEINCPLYSSISKFSGTGLTAESVGTDAQSFASYYGTLNSNVTFTVTFNDKGWFAGTTIC